MKTCEKCTVMTRSEMRRATHHPIDMESTISNYNALLEDKKADGYVWDPDTSSLVKQCAECASAGQ